MSAETPPLPGASERLFSYGTLRQAEVQMATFGRLLAGTEDRLPGYRLQMLAIRDPQVVATSGKSHHPIAIHTGRAEDGIAGTVFAVTEGELSRADDYEVADYRRELVTLKSGRRAWVYLDARATDEN